MKTQGLQLRSNGYHFRMRVPADLRGRVGKAEVVRSLGTTLRPEANAAARDLRTLVRAEFKRLRDDPTAAFELHEKPTKPAPPVTPLLHQPVEPQGGHSIAALMALYQEERGDEWGANHAQAVRFALKLFLDQVLHGDRPIADVGRQEVAAYKRYLRWTDRRISTTNRMLTQLGGFFRWAVYGGYMLTNPVEGQKLRAYAHVRSERAAFSDDELRRIFSPEFKERALKGRNVARYWLPVIMRWSGLRPEEVIQLRVGDLHEVDGVFCFDLRGDHFDIKTEAGRRLVPVHPRLVDLGFPMHLDLEVMPLALMRRILPNDQALFPAAAARPTRRARSASRWFNETWLRDTLKITDRRKVLYSLRHTVATKLKAQGCEEALIAELLGHTHAGLTFGRYGKAYPVGRLAEALERLD